MCKPKKILLYLYILCAKRLCAHSTKIRGHPEGESALGASVACWKAAGWRQAKGRYIMLKTGLY